MRSFQNAWHPRECVRECMESDKQIEAIVSNQVATRIVLVEVIRVCPFPYSERARRYDTHSGTDRC